jgi:hypothetical protein
MISEHEAMEMARIYPMISEHEAMEMARIDQGL